MGYIITCTLCVHVCMCVCAHGACRLLSGADNRAISESMVRDPRRRVTGQSCLPSSVQLPVLPTAMRPSARLPRPIRARSRGDERRRRHNCDSPTDRASLGRDVSLPHCCRLGCQMEAEAEYSIRFLYLNAAASQMHNVAGQGLAGWRRRSF